MKIDITELLEGCVHQSAEFGIPKDSLKSRLMLEAAEEIKSLRDQLEFQIKLADDNNNSRMRHEKAIELMAEYIVTLGRVDYFLCDEIPKDIHLKYQPKNDGNYDNEPCQKCVAEYFLMTAGEQK